MLEHHARGRTTLLILVLTLVLTALSKRAAGDDATLDASQDNTLYEISDGSLSNGAGKHLFAGRTGQGTGLDRRRGLLLFDIAASIPAGSTINTVTLRLSMSKTQAPTTSVSVHRLLAQWGEGASDASGSEGAGEDAEAGDATWTYTFYPSESWTTPGGDFAANASASTNVGSEGFYEWSGEALVDDVQAWLDDPGSNAGWILIGNESTSSTAKRFDTHENNDESVHPALIVDYTTALPSGACCLTDGECIVLPSAECVDAGGAYEGDDAPCAAGTCPPAGACCLAGETCDRLTDAACTNQGGTYLGDETTCDGNPCLPDLGACCFSGAVCLEITPADCTAQDGTYLGNGTTCVGEPCPLALTHFVDALPRPAVAQPVSGAPGGAAHYEIAMTQFEQQLHADLQPTTVWGYGGTYPGPTIEARVDELVTVEWINDLRNADGTLRTDHYLEVDLCPHGAADLPKTVVHLHGGHVEQHSDGYPEDTFLPGSSSEIYEYPNHQTPGTIWYHDHGLGITRLNVYMGLAGFYLIRDDVEDGLGLPSGEYEIPLAIQDRSFNLDGSWAYPAVWQDHFFGDTILVNGKVWPYLEVDRGMYRFRVLNGSNSRVYTLALSNGATFVQIGGDGGLLEAPVEHTELTITGGERADLVMDFSAYPPGTEIILTNSAPAPYPGSPGVGVIPDIMKFIVVDEVGHTTPLPDELVPIEPLLESSAVAHRDFELRKQTDECAGQVWLINGLGWHDITERPILDTVEVWSFINRSGQSHPMHMHLVFFQVLDRQAFEIDGDEIIPVGPVMPPDPGETGWKDTVQARPQQITRVIARFEDYAGLFSYHCHILEHEDHEMMRQFEVVACPADVNDDAQVDVSDLVAVILAWGVCPPGPESCPADITGDGTVDVTDLVEVILDWGACG